MSLRFSQIRNTVQYFSLYRFNFYHNFLTLAQLSIYSAFCYNSLPRSDSHLFIFALCKLFVVFFCIPIWIRILGQISSANGNLQKNEAPFTEMTSGAVTCQLSLLLVSSTYFLSNLICFNFEFWVFLQKLAWPAKKGEYG